MDPAAIVQAAEDAHASMDVSRMLECFEEDIVAYWNGKKIAGNIAELSDWYHAFFDTQQSFELTKTLQVASGNRIAVRWTHNRVDANGDRFEAHAAEFWTLSERNRLVEWHAYCIESPA